MAAKASRPLLTEAESNPELNDKSRLAQAYDACIDHPADCSDSRNASPEQRAEHPLDTCHGNGIRPDLHRCLRGCK